MAELPSGTVTFLFTDLEGSTRLWESHPAVMATALARHDAILRAAIDAHDGQVVKTTGDGFHAVFRRADDAIGAAIDAQRVIVAEPWGDDVDLLVRMGLHAGTSEERGGDYYGSAVNRAARLTAVGHGGQVLVSRAVEELVGDGLDESIELVSLGEHGLRDLQQPMDIFQVVAPGLPSVFPALQSLEARLGNLPVQHSSFVGRQREAAELAAMLRTERLVTLTGVGGVGKTRLACHVAQEVLTEFRDGAWLVELARVRDPDVVVDAVAAVLGVTQRAGVQLLDTLVVHLRRKELLLVLDNCEHLLDAVVELVHELEESCPGVAVLSTSREGLGIAGERIVVVPSLTLPKYADRETVSNSDAARLLIARAVSVQSDFELTDANAAAIAEVVRRLDGIPLALELAAARIPMLGPAQLAQRLDQRFRVLAGGRRGAIERHATLRAAIDWSYDLLSADEQQVLARLSVFAGGCTLEAAEAVCSGPAIDDLAVFDLLTVLVARSLVVAEDATPTERRYRLLETIRQYAEERIEEVERATLRDRHADFFVELAEEAGRELRGAEQLRWLVRIDVERENLRTALAWSMETGDAARAARFLRASLGGVPSPLARVLLPDAEAVLQLPGIETIEHYPFALAAAAAGALYHGRFDRIAPLCDEAVDHAGAHTDELAGFTALVRANALYRDPGSAVVLLEQAVDSYRRAGDPYMLAFSLGAVASYRANDRDPSSKAVDEGRECLAQARVTGCPGVTGGALSILALVLVHDEPEQSRALIAESIELNAALGAIPVEENALVIAFIVSALLGEREQALRLTTHALERGLSMLITQAACLEVTADLLARDEIEVAAVLHGAVDELVPGLARAEPYVSLRERTEALIHGRLEPAPINGLHARGAAMSEDHTSAYALDAISRLTGIGRR